VSNSGYFELGLDVPADAIGIARSLSERPDLALLLDTSGTTPAYVACDACEISNGLDPEPQLRLDNSLQAEFPRWIGVLPYEVGRGVERGASADSRALPHLIQPEWRRYGAVIEVHGGVRIVGTDRERGEALKQLVLKASPVEPSAVRLLGKGDPEPPGTHLQRIRSALAQIAAGQIYQVNLARRAVFELEGRAVDVLEKLLDRTDGPFCAVLALNEIDVMATSPELFLSLAATGALESIPIKGTRPRGVTELYDQQLRAELASDPKEQAELAMVVDVVRNDLGRIATTGSVQLAGGFQVESFRSVHHRGARVVAQLSPTATREQLFLALLPSGSVTGAPKSRAMELIAELEADRRGLYTGAFGMIRENGGVRLGMAIRTLTRHRETGETHYFSGGGIVADSVPDLEVEETNWKSAHLSALAG